MGKVLVQAADVVDGRVARMKVTMDRLPARVLDRDAVIAWMRDGHSFLPVVGGVPGRALQLVELDDAAYVRDDHEATPADALPALPAV